MPPARVLRANGKWLNACVLLLLSSHLAHLLQPCQPGKAIIRKEVFPWSSSSDIHQSVLPLLNNEWILSLSLPSISSEHRAKGTNSVLSRKSTLDTKSALIHCLFHRLPFKSPTYILSSVQGVWNHICVAEMPVFLGTSHPRTFFFFFFLRRKQKVPGRGCSRRNGR